MTMATCAVGVDSDASGYQPDEGGAMPLPRSKLVYGAL